MPRSRSLGGYQLDPGGKVSTTKGIQDTNMAWHFDERAGAQELRPFGYLAFRYLEVDGARGEQLTTDDVQIDARHAQLPRRERGPLRHEQPDPERGLEPRAPLRALRRARAVRRHADAREGPVPRRLVQRVAGDDGRVRRTLAHVPVAARLRPVASALLARRSRQRRVPERRRQARHPRRHADVRRNGCGSTG